MNDYIHCIKIKERVLLLDITQIQPQNIKQVHKI